MSEPPTVNATLREVVTAMAHLPDDTVFRWYQTSATSRDGVPQATATLRLTLGQVRAELATATSRS